MKCIKRILLFLVVAVLAEKETTKNQHIDQITDQFIKVLEKRLNEWDDDKSDGLEDISEECFFNLNNGSIIRTHDSIEAGATFIKSPQVDSRSACQEVCCDIANCNLAVYKEKEDEATACYLFDCGSPSICLFTSHPGFVAMDMPRRETTNKVQAKHEQALEDLVTTSTTTVTEPPTTPLPTTTTTTSATTMEPKQPEDDEDNIIEELIKLVTKIKSNKVDQMGLFGECKNHKDCAGSSTECLAGFCVCQEGYHAQDGVCRKDCSRFEFECQNEGQPLSYPQCIAIYDKCDGIIHCKDHSDEDNCGRPEDEPSEEGNYLPASPNPQKPPYAQQRQVPFKPNSQSVPNSYPVDQSYSAQLQNYGPQNVNPGQNDAYPPGQNYYQGNQVPPQQAAPQQALPQGQQNQQVQQQIGIQTQGIPVQQQVPQQQPSQGLEQHLGPQVPPYEVPAEQTNNQHQHMIQRKPGVDRIQIPQRPQQLSNVPNSPIGRDGDPSRNRGLDRNNNNIPDHLENGHQLFNYKKPDDDGSIVKVNTPLKQLHSTTVEPRTEIVHRPSHEVKTQTEANIDPFAEQQAYWNFAAGPGDQGYGPPYDDPSSNGYNSYVPVRIPGNNYGSRNKNYGNPKYNGDRSYGPYRNGGLYQNSGFGGVNNNGIGYGTSRGYFNNLYNQAGGAGYNNPEYEPYYEGAGNGYPANSDYDYYSDNPDKDSDSTTDEASAEVSKAVRPGKPSSGGKLLPSEKAHPDFSNHKSKAPSASKESKEDQTPAKDSSGSSRSSSESAEKSGEISIDKETPSTPSSTSVGDLNEVNIKPQKGEQSINKDLTLPNDEEKKQVNNDDKEVMSQLMIDSVAYDAVRKNQGAVIALALGLVVTALLLIFVGCRLRNVKRRLRKGRPLNSNEADYLINGMYL